MKKTLIGLHGFCRELLESFVSILSVIFFSSFKTNKYFRTEKKKRKDSDVCYILCNGPSLQSLLDSNNVPDKNMFVVNFFANTEVFFKIKPDNYFVLDNILVGRATKERMERAQTVVDQLYENLSKVSWSMNLYYPSDGSKKVLSRILENKNITAHIYNKTPVSGLKCLSLFLYKKNLGMPRPENISNAAVFCALNSGYKKIYLYGVEHSWMRSFDIHPETHRLYMNDGHFYEKENIRWFKRGDYLNWLGSTQQAMKSHFELRSYADSIGAKIVNKTPTSFIEAYEFEEY